MADIRASLAANDPEDARRFAESFIQALRLIEAQPEIGRPTMGGSVTRECPVPGLPYFIPYRVKNGHIEVLRVYHTRRNRPPDWPAH